MNDFHDKELTEVTVTRPAAAERTVSWLVLRWTSDSWPALAERLAALRAEGDDVAVAMTPETWRDIECTAGLLAQRGEGGLTVGGPYPGEVLGSFLGLPVIKLVPPVRCWKCRAVRGCAPGDPECLRRQRVIGAIKRSRRGAVA